MAPDGRDEGDTSAAGERVDPLELYQRYDRLNRRRGWRHALSTLRRDVEAGRQPLRRRDVARRYGLAEDWSWRDLAAQLAREPKPLEAFNSFLRVLYRGLR